MQNQKQTSKFENPYSLRRGGGIKGDFYVNFTKIFLQTQNLIISGAKDMGRTYGTLMWVAGH